MQSVKEAASNINATSAKAGLEKTKAVVQEKVEKMSAHDPVGKEMATEKREERINQANLHKQEAREHNAKSHTQSTTGAPGQSIGMHQMSAMPGQGTGQSFGGMVEDGIATAHPSGLRGATTGHNTLL